MAVGANGENFGFVESFDEGLFSLCLSFGCWRSAFGFLPNRISCRVGRMALELGLKRIDMSATQRTRKVLRVGSGREQRCEEQAERLF